MWFTQSMITKESRGLINRYLFLEEKNFIQESSLYYQIILCS